MNDKNTFNVYDTSVNVTSAKTDDWPSYRRLREVLRGAGYILHKDPMIVRRFPSLKKTHHAGSRRDVHFFSSISPRMFQFEFYEDVVRDNRCGGRYHFQKMRKMPYLRRLAVQAIIRKLTSCLEAHGFIDKSKVLPEEALPRIHAHRASLEDFQGADFYKKPPSGYHSKDADGHLLRDGVVRYFRAWNGRLVRGVVYHNINNMWWVHVNRYEARNIAAFELFTYDPTRHARKAPESPKRSLERALASALKRQDYERAIGMRDALRKIGA